MFFFPFFDPAVGCRLISFFNELASELDDHYQQLKRQAERLLSSFFTFEVVGREVSH
jgi:hypothetical protein